ncbi:hypothetical protein Y1Q_0006614 [Alligator mississippiensis]|uniref:Uncharacterized protein n=1 Tax=Alligator mississippiensis TaxID=8496 RepID=A0A151P750_ALLMI|nr:hypothetical protein Y1Q_0006614 [Alligator mississippiensis]
MAQALGLHLLPETCFDELFSAFTCCTPACGFLGVGEEPRRLGSLVPAAPLVPAPPAGSAPGARGGEPAH